MKKFFYCMNLRKLFRRKYILYGILFTGFFLFSLEVLIQNRGDVFLTYSRKNGVRLESRNLAGIIPEVDENDLYGSRRQNRNLQNVYPYDINRKSAAEIRNNRANAQVRINGDYVQMRAADNIAATLDKASMTAGQYNTQQFVQSQSGSINHQSMGENHIQTKRLPQAIIIGVKKGGTRALLEFLRAHPNVRATGPEPHFFDKYYERGLEWYRNLMPTSDPNQITIEKTPSYFITKEVPRRVFEMSSDMKLIVVVRDPVIRAISDYAQVTSRLKKFKSFEEMAFIDNNTQIIDTSWAVIKIGLYAKHLQRWLQVFPLEQFHFVSGENLIRNPGDEMLSVQSFLGLDPILTHKNFITNNTRGFPCVRKKTSGKGHCLEGNKGRPHPYVHPRVIERLREFYRPSNQKFYKLVGRSFDWP